MEHDIWQKSWIVCKSGKQIGKSFTARLGWGKAVPMVPAVIYEQLLEFKRH